MKITSLLIKLNEYRVKYLHKVNLCFINLRIDKFYRFYKFSRQLWLYQYCRRGFKLFENCFFFFCSLAFEIIYYFILRRIYWFIYFHLSTKFIYLFCFKYWSFSNKVFLKKKKKKKKKKLPPSPGRRWSWLSWPPPAPRSTSRPRRPPAWWWGRYPCVSGAPTRPRG